DFYYSDEAFSIMERDISACEKAGAAGVVFGLLLPDGTVDVNRVKQLVELAYPMDVTFHRAFDMSRNLFEALDAIVACGIKRILTSGGYAKAIDGINEIQQLIEYSAGRVTIMAGSGLNDKNLVDFFNAGVTEFHASATKFISSPMQYHNNRILFEQYPGMQHQMQTVDGNQIAAMRNTLNKFKKH
ncbi:MAG TPA: copper homeostasis protein CutC, partial [Bacteroidia bacterium]|nr:copper homeostasis protein CutC [Bacteroidia bacterium]